MWLKSEKNKEFKYNIKNFININIKKLFTFFKIFFLPPPKNLETPDKNFFEKKFDS